MKKVLRKIAGLFMVAIMSFSSLSPVLFALSDAGKVEINKTAKKLGDEKTSRDAEITLSVSGKPFSIVSKTDVVLVLDRSSSMDDMLNEVEKRISAKNAANDLVDSLITESSKDNVRIAVVPFGTKVGTVTDLTSNKNVIKGAISSAYSSKIENEGTNVQAGLNKAKDILSKTDNNKIVILLSDGEPTFYDDPTYGTVGTGLDDSAVCLEYGLVFCLKKGVRPSEAAISVANDLKKTSTIYTIGFGQINNATSSFLTKVATQGKYYSAYNSSALNKAFKEIAKDINTIATNVVVTDIVPEGFIVDEEALKKEYKDAVTITYDNGKTILTWNIDKLDATSVNELKYKVTAKEGYYGSMFTNENATISGSPSQGNPYYDGNFTHTFPKPSITVPGITKDDNYALDNNYNATIGKSLFVSKENGLLKNDLLNIEMTEDADSVANKIVVNKESLCGTLNVNEITGEFTYTPDSSCIKEGTTNNVTFTYFVETSIIKNGVETVVKSNTSTVTIKVVKQQTSYLVRYLEEGTGKVLAEDKNNAGYVGDVITENAIDIKGYDRTSLSTKSITLKESNNIIIFYYKKKPAKIAEQSIVKTGTISINNKNINVDYQINYKANIVDYMGDAKVVITDILPYMIDVNKSNLDGAKYDASKNTLTWEININDIDTFENGTKVVNISKNISVSYIGIDITADTLENKVNGKIKLENTVEKKVSDSFETKIDINGTLRIYYVDKNGNELLKTEEYVKKAGSSYETSSKQIDGYELVSVTGNEKGKYTDSLIEVIYKYDKVKAVVDEENTIVQKTGTNSIISKNDKIDYNITYHTEINKYIGDGKLTIVDTLPYKIDTSKANDLGGGIYNEKENTITWTIELKNINTYEDGIKKIDFNKNISLYYKDINIESDKITNKVNATLSLDTIDDVVNETEFDTNVDINGKLIVKYVDLDDNELIKSKEFIKKAGTSYEVTKEEIKDYDFVKVIGNEKGKYTDDVIEVKYVYTRKQAKVTEDKIVKEGTLQINKSDVKVSYKINYNANVKDYLGNAKVIIVDKLPYMIDVNKSNLDGGVYDASKNTITWIEEINNIDTYENGIKKINIVKNIDLYYLGVDITSVSFTNKVSGNLELETAKVSPSEDEFETLVKVNGNLIVKYVDEDNNELSPVERTEKKVGTNYETSPLKIKGYTLKEVIGNQTGRYTEEDTLVIYVYKRTSTSYKIKYLESNTNEELLPTKTKIGFVNDKVSENATSIEGYELVSDEALEIVLDEDNNEIVFYYNKVAEVVSTGITDQNKPYYLIFVISTSIVGCLLYFKKKLL